MFRCSGSGKRFLYPSFTGESIAVRLKPCSSKRWHPARQSSLCSSAAKMEPGRQERNCEHSFRRFGSAWYNRCMCGGVFSRPIPSPVIRKASPVSDACGWCPTLVISPQTMLHSPCRRSLRSVGALRMAEGSGMTDAEEKAKQLNAQAAALRECQSNTYVVPFFRL